MNQTLSDNNAQGRGRRGERKRGGGGRQKSDNGLSIVQGSRCQRRPYRMMRYVMVKLRHIEAGIWSVTPRISINAADTPRKRNGNIEIRGERGDSSATRRPPVPRAIACVDRPAHFLHSITFNASSFAEMRTSPRPSAGNRSRPL